MRFDVLYWILMIRGVVKMLLFISYFGFKLVFKFYYMERKRIILLLVTFKRDYEIGLKRSLFDQIALHLCFKDNNI